MKKYAKLIAAVCTTMMLASLFAGCGAGGSTTSTASGAKESQAAPAADSVKEEAPAAESVKEEAPAAESVKEEAPASEAQAPAGEAKKMTFGMIYNNVGPFWDQATNGAEAAAKTIMDADSGVEIEIITAAPVGASVSQQIDMMEDMISSGVDGIGITCTDVVALTPIIDSAMDKGIPVICFDTDAKDSKRLCFVGADSYAFGALQAEAAAELCNYEGGVLVENGIVSSEVMVQRLKGVEDTIAKYPNMEILDVQASGGDEAKALQDVETMTSTYPDFKALIFMDASAEAAVTVWKANGWTINDKVSILAADLDGIVSAVKNDIANLTLTSDPGVWGEEVVKILYDYIINGVEPPDVTYTDYLYIDKEFAIEHYPDVQ